MHEGPIAAGKSSFDLIDHDAFFREIAMPEGTIFLDAACGTGNYSLALSPRLGVGGLIYAVDLWEGGIRSLEKSIAERGITNITPLVGDLARLSLADRSVDGCLMATVLHDLAQEGSAAGALAEACRILRPGGILYVVEFKKIDGPPGPPRRVRLAREELLALTGRFDLVDVRTVELGQSAYLSVFRLGTAFDDA